MASVGSERKEMLYLTTHSTHFIYGYMASVGSERKEMFNLTTHSTHFIYGYMASVGSERKEMFNLTTHSTHFIYGYMASDIMVKDHSKCEKGNPLPPYRLLFPINSKGSFICTIPQTG